MRILRESLRFIYMNMVLQTMHVHMRQNLHIVIITMNIEG